jgi:hypothetical protein
MTARAVATVTASLFALCRSRHGESAPATQASSGCGRPGDRCPPAADALLAAGGTELAD